MYKKHFFADENALKLLCSKVKSKFFPGVLPPYPHGGTGRPLAMRDRSSMRLNLRHPTQNPGSAPELMVRNEIVVIRLIGGLLNGSYQ